MRTIGRRVGRGIAVALAVAFAYAAYVYLTLPDVRPLRTVNPRSTAFIELRAREARARGDTPRRTQHWVSYARISRHLKDAVRVAEDSLFWQHDGVDYQQLKESMEVNLERLEFARGASTITQQLAKNLYLSPSKNPVRKLRELLIARRLEAELSKQRIYEIYLNVIEWGDGIYGAEAAARRVFGKSAAELSAHESALLAAAIINPRVLDPGHPSTRLRRRQQMILRRMGWVEPPPVLAEPFQGAPQGTPPAALPAVGPPTQLPGQVLPPSSQPPRPPGGGRLP
jgi:monofunctional biosynthetic peptidoglycan transglycosylase